MEKNFRPKITLTDFQTAETVAHALRGEIEAVSEDIQHSIKTTAWLEVESSVITLTHLCEVFSLVRLEMDRINSYAEGGDLLVPDRDPSWTSGRWVPGPGENSIFTGGMHYPVRNGQRVRVLKCGHVYPVYDDEIAGLDSGEMFLCATCGDKLMVTSVFTYVSKLTAVVDYSDEEI